MPIHYKFIDTMVSRPKANPARSFMRAFLYSFHAISATLSKNMCVGLSVGSCQYFSCVCEVRRLITTIPAFVDKSQGLIHNKNTKHKKWKDNWIMLKTEISENRSQVGVIKKGLEENDQRDKLRKNSRSNICFWDVEKTCLRIGRKPSKLTNGRRETFA